MAHLSLSTHSSATGKYSIGGSLLKRLTSLTALWRSRAALADLPAERLEDLGLTVDQARQEAGKAPWDVPAHWLK